MNFFEKKSFLPHPFFEVDCDYSVIQEKKDENGRKTRQD